MVLHSLRMFELSLYTSTHRTVPIRNNIIDSSRVVQNSPDSVSRNMSLAPQQGGRQAAQEFPRHAGYSGSNQEPWPIYPAANSILSTSPRQFSGVRKHQIWKDMLPESDEYTGRDQPSRPGAGRGFDHAGSQNGKPSEQACIDVSSSSIEPAGRLPYSGRWCSLRLICCLMIASSSIPLEQHAQLCGVTLGRQVIDECMTLPSYALSLILSFANP